MKEEKREKEKGQVGQGFLQSLHTKEKVQEKKVGENPALPALFYSSFALGSLGNLKEN
jgi:hypothetical protein